MTRRICVITGSRAEYGLLRWVLEDISGTSGLQLQLIATGMHLSPEFGLTYREIESDGFAIDRRIETLVSSDTPCGLAKSMGLGLIGFGDALQQLHPDIVMVVGDRFEILPAVVAALVARIPVAHAHGGEVSEGAFDEAIRHSITKMSHLHFVAAEEYRRRVIQLGEHPDSVFVVGALGLDAIGKLDLLGRAELERSLGLKLGSKNLLITFHPETLGNEDPEWQMRELLAALDALADTTLIFTLPNADTGNRALAAMMRDFASDHANARLFTSLGQRCYLSCISHVDGVIGNSSSGLIEVPSFGKGTINIGARQRGRLRADGVIDCEANRRSIGAALSRLYSPEFQVLAKAAHNPCGGAGASGKIVKILSEYPLQGLAKKSFRDLPAPV